jgi:hypothetical protein
VQQVLMVQQGLRAQTVQLVQPVLMVQQGLRAQKVQQG